MFPEHYEELSHTARPERPVIPTTRLVSTLPYRGAGHCFYFDYVVLLSILVVAGGPFLIITNTLLHVHDVFNIRGEILRSIGGSMILSSESIASLGQLLEMSLGRGQ